MKNLLVYLFGVLAKMVNFIVDAFAAMFRPITWKPVMSMLGNLVSFVTGKYIFDKQPCSATGGTA